MPTPTQVSPAPSQAQAATPPRARIWGDKGVSERFIVQDQQMIPSPAQQQLILADAGLLSELQHHLFGTLSITTGTALDFQGPYNIYQVYNFFAGSNTPLVSVSGHGLGFLQVLEYPFVNLETNADVASLLDPLTNASDIFNAPTSSSATIFRVWTRVPLALKLAGVRGGYVGYITLQNKRIANIVKPTFALTGSSPYSIVHAAGTANGSLPYQGATAVTLASPTMETWKLLNTIPRMRSQMPLFGFTRYITEVQQPYTSGSFTYNFEPGGELLRALFQFVDATTTGVPLATTNLQFITFQYGTNKQMDVYTPYRNIQEQVQTYGRNLGQGVFIFDYYTKNRTLVNTKSTENTANVQVVATFATAYAPPANSLVNVLLDKVFVVQNYLGK